MNIRECFVVVFFSFFYLFEAITRTYGHIHIHKYIYVYIRERVIKISFKVFNGVEIAEMGLEQRGYFLLQV